MTTAFPTRYGVDEEETDDSVLELSVFLLFGFIAFPLSSLFHAFPLHIFSRSQACRLSKLKAPEGEYPVKIPFL